LRLGFGHSFSSASAAQASKGRPVRGAASSSTASSKESPSPTLSAPPNSSQPSTTSSHSHRLQTDPLEPRLSLTFTCTAPDCSTRSSHTFTKRAYERGVVLVQCPGCKNRHLIADHLSWFKDSTDEGRLRTVEDFVKARGEKVRRGELKIGDGEEGVLEFSE
jgi:protein import protein ZIM17